MNAVTMTNRKFGPAIVMELAEQRAPQGFANIEKVISRRELEDISLGYKIEAGFDPVSLNQQPSLTVQHPLSIASWGRSKPKQASVRAGTK
jgi:hypothetical protein